MSESNNFLSVFKTLSYTTVLTGSAIFLSLYTINKLEKGKTCLLNYYNTMCILKYLGINLLNN